MNRFGWCADGFHEGGTYKNSRPCPGEAKTFDIVKHKVVYDGKTRVCECLCHTEGIEALTKKKKRKRK